MLDVLGALITKTSTQTVGPTSCSGKNKHLVVFVDKRKRKVAYLHGYVATTVFVVNKGKK